jgi:hypothetical protein
MTLLISLSFITLPLLPVFAQPNQGSVLPESNNLTAYPYWREGKTSTRITSLRGPTFRHGVSWLKPNSKFENPDESYAYQPVPTQLFFIKYVFSKAFF